jgi:hypothetical protein
MYADLPNQYEQDGDELLLGQGMFCPFRVLALLICLFTICRPN